MAGRRTALLAVWAGLSRAQAGSGAPELVPMQGGAACRGYEKEWGACPDLPSCKQCTPVDCAFATWEDWFPAGGCTGLCMRHRRIHTSNNECGAPCSGPKIETKECLLKECAQAKQDCELGDWNTWTKCSSQLGQRFRHRRILKEPQGDGRECEGGTNETSPCSDTSPVDCALSEWGSWTDCSASCGGGWHAQMRRMVQQAAPGGKPCRGSLRRTRPCGTQPCGGAEPCVMGDWTEWAGCNLESPFQRYRSREVAQPAKGDGAPCNEPVRETEGCAPVEEPEACKFSTWGDWTACDKSCGSGQTFRRRTLERPPKHGGQCEGGSLAEAKPCKAAPCFAQRPMDCELSNWGHWSPCSSKCGTGVSLRRRNISRAARPGGEGCVDAMTEIRGCSGIDPDLCAKRDCSWADWEEWGACSETCGGGVKRRNRVVAVSPMHGGRLCDPQDKSEARACNLQSCQQCVDGAWMQWTEWSACSATCDRGFRSRHRDVARQPNACGQPVVGLEDEYELCQLDASCVPDQDCRLSEWTDWSGCTCECFGVSERQRHVVQWATGNGRTCVNESVKEVAQCNPGVGEAVPGGCGVRPPKNCQLAAWSEWSKCSMECGGGVTTRTRHILSPAEEGGKPCEDSLSEVDMCNTQPCDEKCIDCEWDQWSDWSMCSSCASQRYRQRKVAALANHCGKACKAGDSKETSGCTSSCVTEQRFCSWSEWSKFSDCTAECGPATHLRQRSMRLLEDEPTDYLFRGTSSSTCAGMQLDVAKCETVSCEKGDAAVDCVFGAWGQWAEPTCTQLCERTRNIEIMNALGGKSCNGPLAETKRCTSDCTKVEDCTFSPWHDWGHCQNSTAQRYRSRSIHRMAANGGKQCDGMLRETASCSGSQPPITACTLHPWSDWGECSKSCEGGVQERRRSIKTLAQNGGSPCDADLQELQTCGTEKCPGKVVSCKTSDWGEWSSCSEDSQKFRQRKVLREGSRGGKPCKAHLEEVAPCAQTLDCMVSEWTEWDGCDKTCGCGQHARHRQVVKNPHAGGKPCPPDLMEVEGCHCQACDRVDCEVGSWTDWSACSATCGLGQQNRRRELLKLPKDGGDGCNLGLEEAKQCEASACNVTDCVWGLWSDWSSCTIECDGGQRTRDRHIVQAPGKGGKPCDPLRKEEIEACNTQRCNSHKCVDGAWDDWEDWQPCSSSCKGGTTWRSRKVLREASACGEPATGPSRVSASCNQGVPCEPVVHCVFTDWSDWGACSDACSGLRHRSRRIAAHGRGDGRFCEGDLKQTGPCNPTEGEAAPKKCLRPRADCKLGDWEEWGACSASCGGGQQARSREVLQQPQGGGRGCNESLASTRGCHAGACAAQCELVDCTWGHWGEWSACDKCGGERKRFRFVSRQARCGGRPCKPGAAEEVMNCTRSCHSPSYCAFGDWHVWSSCSAECGSGVRSRLRQLRLAPLPVQFRKLERQEAPAHDAKEPGEAALQAKFQELHRQSKATELHRLQELVAAFAGGLVSLTVVLALARALLRRRPRRDMVAVPTAAE